MKLTDKISTTERKKLVLPCDCFGGEKYCGRMELWVYDDSIEFNFFERKKKKAMGGVWLIPKSLLKLKKFLNKNVCIPSKKTI